MLKERCKRNSSSILSRATTMPMDELEMRDGIGHHQKSESLEAQIFRDMNKYLPQLDKDLVTYIAEFNAPNIALFLRMIRCNNMLALRQLAVSLDTELVKERYAHAMSCLPVGSISELQYVMDYTRTFAKYKIASVLPKPGNILKPPEPPKNGSNAETLLAFIREAIIAKNGHTDDFKQTPLYQKLELCSRALARLVQSFHFKFDNGEVSQSKYFMFKHEETLLGEETQRHASIAMKIITNALSLMYRPTTVYFLSVGYPQKYDQAMQNCNCYRIAPFENNAQERQRLQKLASAIDPTSCSRAEDKKWLQLTWPARDSNIITRPHAKKCVFVTKTPTSGGKYHSYYNYENMQERSRTHDGMDKDETSMFNWMITDACLGNLELESKENVRKRNGVPDNVITAIQQTHEWQEKYKDVNKLRADFDAVIEVKRGAVTAEKKIKPLQGSFSPDNIKLCLRWKRFCIATIFMDAVNGLVFQAFEAYKERRESRAGSKYIARKQKPRLTDPFDNTPKEFSYAFEYFCDPRRPLESDFESEEWQPNPQKGYPDAILFSNDSDYDFDNKKVFDGLVFFQASMRIPFADYFVLSEAPGDMREVCEIRRTRKDIKTDQGVEDDNWVFGEKIRWQPADTSKPSYRSEIWLTTDAVETEKPIQVRFNDWTHKIYEVPRLVSGTIDDYTRIGKFEDMELSQWPSYTELLNGPEGTYIDESLWENNGVEEQIEFDTLLTNLTKEI